MKFTFAIATLAALSQAYYLDEFVKEAPPGMGKRSKRFTKQGKKKILDEQANYRELSRECKKNVKKFDKYCHNVGKGKGEKKYSDYRDDDLQCSYCTVGDDGLCTDVENEPRQFHCIAQQCAFDYCIWYRDQYIEACEQSVEDEIDVPDLPNWGDVYNYDELHGDYLLWYESDGQEGFTTQMCVDYYRMYDDAEERDAQAGDEDDDMDDDDMDEDDEEGNDGGDEYEY